MPERRAWSPRMMAGPRGAPPELLDREVDQIVALLRDEGPLTRAAIRDRLETRRWGPGRLGQALAEARRRGRVTRAGRRMYEAAGG